MQVSKNSLALHKCLELGTDLGYSFAFNHNRKLMGPPTGEHEYL